MEELLVLETKFKEKLRRYYQPAYKSRESLTDVISFIHLEWYNRNPSSGENAVLNLFSRLSTIKNEIYESSIKYYILFLDEGDAGFHPEWKKKYVEILTEILPYLFEKDGIEFQIIFTTHDPLTLSDVLKYNIVYFNKKVDDNHTILNYDDKNNPSKSFAANISDLISDSFFIDGGLIGDFSKRKIKETIKWLNMPDDKSNAEYYENLVLNIDEHIVKRKLSEMYDEKMNTDLRKKIIEEQIKKLQTLRDNYNDFH